MYKKVIITIEKGRYAPGVREGKEYTSIAYSASSYGGASPCDTPEEIERTIKHAKEVIKEAGDIPVIENKIEEKKLDQFF